MKTKSIIQSKDVASVFIVTAAILMIPLVMMQFSNEWDWNQFDFAIIGTLLVGIGLLVAIAARKIKKSSQKVAVIVALLATLLLVYIHLAVGIVDSWPLAGN